MRRTPAAILLLVVGLASGGCTSPGVETEYGRSRGPSVNGTAVLADLFREQGHTVRATVRLNDNLAEATDTIVRFAPYPGPPGREEAAWYADWLEAKSDRRLIYVPCDFDAEHEYWSEVLARLPKDADPRLREQNR